MREKHTVQRSIFEHYAEPRSGVNYRLAISIWTCYRVATDIDPYNVEDTGRKGCQSSRCCACDS